MPCSPAKLEANLRNALRSTGPRTAEGKERCRRNALKHGLTGEGVVLPVEDEAAVEGRFAAFEKELGAEGEVGRCLARRAALMSVRLDRAAEHEAAMVARRVRVSEELYDEERRSHVDELAAALREMPATVVRRLRAMPEGIDWLVGAWGAIQADLRDPGRVAWNGGHWSRIENLMGRRPGERPAPEVEALCHACWGNLELLDAGQGAELAPEARVAWARDRLAGWIDDRIAELEALRPALDRGRVDADRADAARRALFDPSPQATLARKYEAATERGLYRALKELKEMKEVEARARAVEAGTAAIEAAAVGPFFPEPGAPIEATPPGRSGKPSRLTPRVGDRPEASAGGRDRVEGGARLVGGEGTDGVGRRRREDRAGGRPPMTSRTPASSPPPRPGDARPNLGIAEGSP